MITVQQVKQALTQVEAGENDEARVAASLAERVNHELAGVAPADREVGLQRVKPFYGDQRVLRWTFWCETCHLPHVALLARPSDG